jgi:hypothetical protein
MAVRVSKQFFFSISIQPIRLSNRVRRLIQQASDFTFLSITIIKNQTIIISIKFNANYHDYWSELAMRPQHVAPLVKRSTLKLHTINT